MFQRIFVRKLPDFRAFPALNSLKAQLNLPHLEQLETLVIYDCFHLSQDFYAKACAQIFSEEAINEVIDELPKADDYFIIEPLPAQFDQRADSAEQCLRLLDERLASCKIRTATAYLITGKLDEAEKQRLKHYFLNPIESREKDLSQTTLPQSLPPIPTPRYPELLDFNDTQLDNWRKEMALAMSADDLRFIQAHFKKLNRPPSETEIRVLDTYWSDHCRHTTFATHLKHIEFPDDDLGQAMQEDLADVLEKRRTVYPQTADIRPITLMELATIDAKYLRKQGKLEDVEFSPEVNACSVFVPVDENGKERTWLVQFKNETHNHPTEIEPFGGASTCIGGAIRDPLSGRAYVYQAMRLSGSADPNEAISDTLAGKLPQRVIAQRSAEGAASYGNQIGLATGQVVEVYHEGYKAKHMEVGAVVAATPYDHVRREVPQKGDLVVLLGGATGRDGCGGATGSSREHHSQSLHKSASEVQKGNPPEERKLQRLFRLKEFSRLIKRCNDFGAGGVAVAVGELADGINITLDAVPVKYQGLSGTELAISESQERMAIVIDANDWQTIETLAHQENVTASVIATITDDNTLRMHYQGEEIVCLDRAFLDTNGAQATQDKVRITPSTPLPYRSKSSHLVQDFKAQLQSLAFADQRGLGDRFDFNVGASCVLLPYGGKYQRTPAEASVYSLPVEESTQCASILAYGFEPYLSAASPYHGAMNAVLEASARLVAAGGDIEKAHFSLQEYFPRLFNDPTRWGAPTAALLGAHHALNRLSRAAIGGKDSMSGTFHDLDIPPTLIAFALATTRLTDVRSPEFKQAGAFLYLLRCPTDTLQRPDFSVFLSHNRFIQTHKDSITSIRAIRHGGALQAVYEATLGNGIGADVCLDETALCAEYGAFLIASSHELGNTHAHCQFIGKTLEQAQLIINGERLDLAELHALQQGLSDVYPLNGPEPKEVRESLNICQHTPKAPVVLKQKTAQVRVCLPVFLGTNSELDTRRAFERAGAQVHELCFTNYNAKAIEESLLRLEASIREAQIFVLSGGFSAGDEPDGSGKFIANVLLNPRIADALQELLSRDGLILGICNGFQALIKSGLLPHGQVCIPSKESPTLAHNTIHRHIARIVSTKIIHNHSPWLRDFAIGDVHNMAISHGEGRFYAPPEALQNLIDNAQIATQYVDAATHSPSMHPSVNPNGSMLAIEGITSPCGRVLGKMGHSERYQAGHYRNYPNFRAQDIFSAGVKAFN